MAFEQANGTEADAAKVQGMMPIVERRQHIDKETGQVIEGMSPLPVLLCCSLLLQIYGCLV